MSNEAKTKTWKRTKTPGLLQHKGGRYYGRFSSGGKTKFVPLETDLLEIARVRFATKRAEVERTRKAARSSKEGTATMADLLEIFRARIVTKPKIAESTRRRLLNSVDYLKKTWPELKGLNPDQVTNSAIEEWRDRALTKGSGYRPPGAKAVEGATYGASPSTVNKSLDALRLILDLAVENAAIHKNPAEKKGLKTALTSRKPILPEAAKMNDVFAAIERGKERGGWAIETADFCRFLAYTGCRLKEAGAVRWRDVDVDKGIIRVHGTKTDAAERIVPLSKAARELLGRILVRRQKAATESRDGQPYVDPASPILAVKEAQRSLNKACAATGVERLTHHDLRDLFATTCIEAGALIPTVAEWLGHVDGGGLLLKVYKHHRQTHSLSEMAKVNF